MKNISMFGFDMDWSTWTWSWTLEDPTSLWCNLAICVFYAVSVKALQLWVASDAKYTPPRWLEPFRKVHNISLAIVSFLMFAVMTFIIYRDGRLNSWHDMSCRLTPNRGLYGFINFIYLVSKLWEWVDTYILVLSQKPVITLHWFHHMTTFTMAAFVHNFPVGGFALINCLVHTVMYMHYATPVRWARPFITSSQLLQFVVVLSIHLFGYLNPDTCFDVRPWFFEWLFCMGVVFGFFVMFLLFFVQEYVSKSGKGKDNKSKTKKEN